jgi:hypothetical protein
VAVKVGVLEEDEVGLLLLPQDETSIAVPNNPIPSNTIINSFDFMNACFIARSLTLIPFGWFNADILTEMTLTLLPFVDFEGFTNSKNFGAKAKGDREEMASPKVLL